MNQKRKLILQALELDPRISSYQKDAIARILQNRSPALQPKLLKQQEVATLLGLSRQAVYKLKKQGTLTPVKITDLGCERYRSSDVMKLIEGGLT